jgi:hypothetical protein
MKCPRCGYVTHDYLDICRKCSTDWMAFKQEIHLKVLEPGDLDLSLLAEAGEDVGRFGNSREFSVDDAFFSTQTLLMNQEETDANVDDDFDIELADTDAPGVVTEEGDTLIQETAGTEDETELEAVGLGEDSHFMMFAEDEEDEAVIDLSAMEEEEAADTPLTSGESFTEDTPSASVEIIDMSDLEDLDEEQEKTPQKALSDEDLAAAVISEDASEHELPEPESDETPPAASSMPPLVETLQCTPPEMQGEPSATASPELPPGLDSDDLLEAELEWELEEPEAVPPKPETRTIHPESDVVLDIEDLELEFEEDDAKDC